MMRWHNFWQLRRRNAVGNGRPSRQDERGSTGGFMIRNRLHGRVLLTPLVALTLWGCPGGGGGGGSTTPTPSPAPTPTPTPTPTLPAVTIAELGTGWNLGNSLDAVNDVGQPFSTSQETYWGNPVVNQQIFNGVAAAGFKSVRIPVTWYQYADSSGNIAPFWLARVKQVVDMARAAGLYVIINTHHENWLNPTFSNQAAADAKLKNFWTQIATYFKDYDNHLLFAGTNEVTVDNSFAAPTAENCQVQAGFNQAFVDAVRATGGNNTSRTLIAQGYTASINYSVDICATPVPTDPTPGRLMMEFHYYDPYDFTLNTTSSIWQWGSIATDPTATEPAYNEAYVDAEMQKAKTAYADKGTPVIIGEFGAILRTNYDPAQKYRNYWDQYVAGSAKRHGFAPFVWDNGYPDNLQLGLFNRSDGSQYYATTISLIVTAS
jgi:endoglucanase